jgi:hypothetical protein
MAEYGNQPYFYEAAERGHGMNSGYLAALMATYLEQQLAHGTSK